MTAVRESFFETARTVRRHRLVGLIVNITPSVFWLGVFFVIPLMVMLLYSFGTRGAFGEVLLGSESLGLQQYRTFFVPEGANVLQATWYTIAWILEWFIPGDIQLASTDPTPYVQLTVQLRHRHYGRLFPDGISDRVLSGAVHP